uniref:Uncharacterized protein n=1 Tax=Myotis lucifugus TaxID=59463 RepID=G1QCP8_MYOLU
MDPSLFRPRIPSASRRKRARRVRGRLPSSSEELPSLSPWPWGCCRLPNPQLSRTEDVSRSKTGSWLGRGDGGFLGGRPRFRLGGDVEMVRVVTVLATEVLGSQNRLCNNKGVSPRDLVSPIGFSLRGG